LGRARKLPESLGKKPVKSTLYNPVRARNLPESLARNHPKGQEKNPL